MNSTNTKPFLSDINELRRRAQQDIKAGAVTPGYGLDANQAVEVLNKVLASEIVCVLRYQRHFYMAQGIHAEAVKTEFQQHWLSEQGHVDILATRIVQLNGEPDFNPQGLLSRAASQYDGSNNTLLGMIEEDLVAERVVIMWYAELARWFGDGDPTTRRIMEQLLADEEEHAEDLASLIIDFQREDGGTTAGHNGSGAVSSGDRSSDAL